MQRFRFAILFNFQHTCEEKIIIIINNFNYVGGGKTLYYTLNAIKGTEKVRWLCSGGVLLIRRNPQRVLCCGFAYRVTKNHRFVDFIAA